MALTLQDRGFECVPLYPFIYICLRFISLSLCVCTCVCVHIHALLHEFCVQHVYRTRESRKKALDAPELELQMGGSQLIGVEN